MLIETVRVIGYTQLVFLTRLFYFNTLQWVQTINKKYFIVTNLITPRALFSPTYLLNLVKPELVSFDPPTPKTPC